MEGEKDKHGEKDMVLVSTMMHGGAMVEGKKDKHGEKDVPVAAMMHGGRHGHPPKGYEYPPLGCPPARVPCPCPGAYPPAVVYPPQYVYPSCYPAPCHGCRSCHGGHMRGYWVPYVGHGCYCGDMGYGGHSRIGHGHHGYRHYYHGHRGHGYGHHGGHGKSGGSADLHG